MLLRGCCSCVQAFLHNPDAIRTQAFIPTFTSLHFSCQHIFPPCGSCNTAPVSRESRSIGWKRCTALPAGQLSVVRSHERPSHVKGGPCYKSRDYCSMERTLHPEKPSCLLSCHSRKIFYHKERKIESYRKQLGKWLFSNLNLQWCEKWTQNNSSVKRKGLLQLGVHTHSTCILCDFASWCSFIAEGNLLLHRWSDYKYNAQSYEFDFLPFR